MSRLLNLYRYRFLWGSFNQVLQDSQKNYKICSMPLQGATPYVCSREFPTSIKPQELFINSCQWTLSYKAQDCWIRAINICSRKQRHTNPIIGPDSCLVNHTIEEITIL